MIKLVVENLAVFCFYCWSSYVLRFQIFKHTIVKYKLLFYCKIVILLHDDPRTKNNSLWVWRTIFLTSEIWNWKQGISILRSWLKSFVKTLLSVHLKLHGFVNICFWLICKYLLWTMKCPSLPMLNNNKRKHRTKFQVDFNGQCPIVCIPCYPSQNWLDTKDRG